MAYSKTIWENGITPVDENNMNNIEQGIYNNFLDIESVNNKIGNLSNLNTTEKSNLVSAINELKDKDAYSSSEIKTNKIWIDNKPIYRKVLTLNITQSSQAVTENVSSLNIETMTFIMGISQSDPTSTNYTWDGTLDKFRAYYNPINKNIYAQTGSNYPTVPCTVYVIIEYTKTSN